MGPAPTFGVGRRYFFLGLPYMICLLSFSVLFLLPTAADVVPFRFFLVGAGLLLLCLILVVVGLTVNDFVDGHVRVKGKLMFERWLKAGERWLNGSSYASKRGRWASIKYETLRTGFDLSGEDFQNIETFIVVRSSVFTKCSAHKVHLARDAYHAYWDTS